MVVYEEMAAVEGSEERKNIEVTISFLKYVRICAIMKGVWFYAYEKQDFGCEYRQVIA